MTQNDDMAGYLWTESSGVGFIKAEFMVMNVHGVNTEYALRGKNANKNANKVHR